MDREQFEIIYSPETSLKMASLKVLVYINNKKEVVNIFFGEEAVKIYEELRRIK